MSMALRKTSPKDIDVSVLARQHGMTKSEFISQQTKAMKEAEKKWEETMRVRMRKATVLEGSKVQEQPTQYKRSHHVYEQLPWLGQSPSVNKGSNHDQSPISDRSDEEKGSNRGSFNHPDSFELLALSRHPSTSENFQAQKPLAFDQHSLLHSSQLYSTASDVPSVVVVEVGEVVQLRVSSIGPPRYGVVRWMGTLPGVLGQVAGIELVSISNHLGIVHADRVSHWFDFVYMQCLPCRMIILMGALMGPTYQLERSCLTVLKVMAYTHHSM